MPRKKAPKPEKRSPSLTEITKTTTIRVDDDLLLLIQEAARRDKIGTADLIRLVLTAHVDQRAQESPEFALEVAAVSQRRHERAIAEISQTLGVFAAASVTAVRSPPPKTAEPGV